MLDAIARENFEPSVVQLHRDIDGDLTGGRPENLAHAVVQPQLLRRVVETGFGGYPWIRFLLVGQYRHWFQTSLSWWRRRFRLRAIVSEPLRAPSGSADRLALPPRRPSPRRARDCRAQSSNATG